MARSDAYLDRLEEEHKTHLDPMNPVDDAILALMVHVAFSDGIVDDSEVEFMERVLPGRPTEALRAWVQHVGSTPLDKSGVREALATEDARWRAFRFAARMAWKDGILAPEEEEMLEMLSSMLELPARAASRALKEVAPNRGITSESLADALAEFNWSAVTLAPGDLASPDLTPVVPPGATMVMRVGVEGVEVVGLYAEGIVGRFREGPAFLPWRDIVTCTRGLTFDSGVELHTEDGRIWRLVDVRMSGLVPLLDRLFRGKSVHRAPAPEIEIIQAFEDEVQN